MSLSTTSLERLLDLASLLTSTLDLEDLLTKILRTAEDLMDAEASSVLLLDSEKGELYYEVATGEAAQKIKEQKRLKVGSGIAGWVAQHRTPLVVPDAYQDARFNRDYDLKTGFKTRNIMCLPLLARDKLIGVAQIINKRQSEEFSSADQHLFSKYCDIAAVAIDNALMHRRLLEQSRIERDMQIAEEIQKTFLPSHAPLIPGLRIEFRSLPCRFVGGDILDLRKLNDGRLSVLVGDVSGKGVPAALFGARFYSVLEYALASSLNTENLMRTLNDFVYSKSSRGMFVTALHALVDPKTRVVQLINAGHLHPVLCGPQPGQMKLLECSPYPPLGVGCDLNYTATTFTLENAQSLILMTDGVTEAKAKTHDRLGDAQAFATLAQNSTLAVPRIMKLLHQFTADEPLADDITLVGVRFEEYEELDRSTESSHLATFRKFADDRAAALGFTTKERSQIELALTETIANIIKHTYKMSTNGRIVMGVTSAPKRIEFHLRDWGPKQDSTQFKSRDLEDIRPGGLGVRFVKEVMDSVEFDDTLPDGNAVHLVKTRG